MSLLAALLLAALAQDETLSSFYTEENDVRSPVRVHLRDSDGKPLKVKDRVAWHDHWIAIPRDYVSLPPGTFRASVEHGPEYEAYEGPLIFREGSKGDHRFDFKRLANL